jgi:hypothetical protein
VFSRSVEALLSTDTGQSPPVDRQEPAGAEPRTFATAIANRTIQTRQVGGLVGREPLSIIRDPRERVLP